MILKCDKRNIIPTTYEYKLWYSIPLWVYITAHKIMAQHLKSINYGAANQLKLNIHWENEVHTYEYRSKCS